MKSLYLSVILILFTGIPVSAQHQGHAEKIRSEYAGQENRTIKSLSDSDIKALSEGQGWGLAKAAELNGVPGPRHVLDMKTELDLSEKQVESIQGIYDKMKTAAVNLGKDILRREKELDEFFRTASSGEDELEQMVTQLGTVYGKLRAVHLKAHLKTIALLSDKQVDMYNDLRGYGEKDPCSEVPEGHDPEMWRMHNNCEQ